jgi:hypothetical protein
MIWVAKMFNLHVSGSLRGQSRYRGVLSQGKTWVGQIEAAEYICYRNGKAKKSLVLLVFNSSPPDLKIDLFTKAN